VMQGREGSERYPQSNEISLEAAILRALRPLDPTITLPWVQEITALYTEQEVIRARNATLLARPENVRGYFVSQFRKIIPAQAAPRPMAAPTRNRVESIHASTSMRRRRRLGLRLLWNGSRTAGKIGQVPGKGKAA